MLAYQRVTKDRPRRDWTYKKDVFVFGPICFRQIYGSEEKKHNRVPPKQFRDIELFLKKLTIGAHHTNRCQTLI